MVIGFRHTRFMEPQEKQENGVLGSTLTLAYLAEWMGCLVHAPRIYVGFLT